MANSDMSDYLLKRDASGHVDMAHLCVERFFVVLRNTLLSDIVSSCLLGL